MSMKTYIAGAYWGSRKEPIVECAQRVCNFFEKLSKISEQLDGWRAKGRSRKTADNNIVLSSHSLDQIVAQLKAGLNTKDVDANEVIPELGFRLGLWNGLSSDLEALSLSVLCGAHSNVRAFENNALITPLLGLDFTDEGLVRDLASAFVHAWAPDFFILAERDALNMAVSEAGGKQWDPFLDLALYLHEDITDNHRPAKFGDRIVFDDGELFLNVPE